MSSTEVSIQTKEFVTVRTCNKVAIFVQNIVLFQKAEIHVHFLDENGVCIEYQIVFMEGDDYAAWSNDDQYVITWTLNKLGLSPTMQVVV